MNPFDVMRAAFEDELEKISGELQGFTRSGRRPIGVDRLLEREAESEMTPSDLAPAGVEKISADGGGAKKLLAAGLVGAGIYHVGRTAEQDRRMGRAMRLQQQAY